MACQAKLVAAVLIVASSLVTGTAGQATNTTIYNPFSEGFGYVLAYDSLINIYNAYMYGAPFSGDFCRESKPDCSKHSQLSD